MTEDRTPAKELLDSEIAFRDLEHCARNLRAEHESPVEVRRLFVEFLRQTRRLCWLLGKEYKRLTGTKWRSDEFWERNAVTTLCRELRDMDEHELPLTLTMTDARSYRLSDLMGPGAPPEGRIGLRAENVHVDPFHDRPPHGVKLFPADSTTGKIRLDREIASSRRLQFTVAARTPKVQAALAKAGVEDVHAIAELCHSTLLHYYQEYRAKLVVELANKS